MQPQQEVLPLAQGQAITTPSISATTTYYVDATDGGCTTATRTAVIATVNTIPTITGTTPGSRCGTGTVILGATASAGTINWYAASSGGTSLGTGTSYTTPSISTTTTYYVDATDGGCTTATRTAVISDGQYYPYDNRDNTRLEVRHRHSCAWGYSKCGDNKLVCSLVRRHLSWNRYELYNASISTTTTYYVDATDGGCTTATGQL